MCRRPDDGLNPQPLPPDKVARLNILNPQPLAPGQVAQAERLNPQPLPPEPPPEKTAARLSHQSAGPQPATLAGARPKARQGSSAILPSEPGRPYLRSSPLRSLRFPKPTTSRGPPSAGRPFSFFPLFCEVWSSGFSLPPDSLKLNSNALTEPGFKKSVCLRAFFRSDGDIRGKGGTTLPAGDPLLGSLPSVLCSVRAASRPRPKRR